MRFRLFCLIPRSAVERPLREQPGRVLAHGENHPQGQLGAVVVLRRFSIDPARQTEALPSSRNQRFCCVKGKAPPPRLHSKTWRNFCRPSYTLSPAFGGGRVEGGARRGGNAWNL